jgi:arylsulfatase
MLLSGTDNHIAGMGTLVGDQTENQIHQPGYEGYLNFDVVSLATLLRDADYNTLMTGKWHLGAEEETAPIARGFTRSFALLPGGGGHFDDLPLFEGEKAPYREDRERVSLPEDFYSTRFYTERLIEYIDQQKHDGLPFFAYLAYTAPHWPLQAPDDSIALYRGRYDSGYDVLHAQRVQRLKELGLLAGDVEPFPRLPGQRPWAELSEAERRVEARKMEIYAAMVRDIDVYVGRLIGYLKQIGEYENTVIFFLSDNGAEGHDLHAAWPELTDHTDVCCDNRLENMGRPDSYVYYGPNWARAGVAPFRMYKAFVNEGGIRVPAFVSHPGIRDAGNVSHTSLTVMDVMPTILELAGVAHPGRSYAGRAIWPLQGRSMLPLLRGESDRVHAQPFVMGWELLGRRAIRSGDWKLVWTTAPYGPDAWQLYDLASDPAENNDLSTDFPEKRNELLALWEQYAAENRVILPDEPSRY